MYISDRNCYNYLLMNVKIIVHLIQFKNAVFDLHQRTYCGWSLLLEKSHSPLLKNCFARKCKTLYGFNSKI